TLGQLRPLLEAGDIVIDGGNSYYRDDITRAKDLMRDGIHYLDVGTSGGVWGLEVGYCMMVGGDEAAVARLAPILDVLAPPDGWDRMGGPGAGHYVKMVHNGIEYSLMQGYAEGFELLHKSEYGLDVEQIAKLWGHASVIRSWLLELAARAFEADGADLHALEGYVEDSGEGRWTLASGIDHDVPMPALSAALFARFASRGNGDYSARMLAALRNQFGGHAVKAAPK
ncbi:MAG: NADP-dependent phosphogluconate dehydrogenase, partial [Solirubrobacterales bacterium]|nr:NADP-dependent phosphogluconate dehydrogenase [Solirubrobacterales bacterium]